MTDVRSILLAVDDTEATTRAVEYIGAILGDRGGVRVVLTHVLRPMPQELLEHGGADDPKEEARIEARQEEAQRQWIEKAGQEEAEPLFQKARTLLRSHGVADAAIETRYADRIPEDRVGDLLEEAAREEKCDTIVVGRNALPWLREKFHRHVAKELAETAEGPTVWVIE